MIEFDDIFDKTGETRVLKPALPELASLPQQFHEKPKSCWKKTFSIEEMFFNRFSIFDTGSSHEDSCQKF